MAIQSEFECRFDSNFKDAFEIKWFCKATDLKRTLKKSSIEDTTRQLAELSVARFKVRNTHYIDQIYKHKTTTVVLGGGQIERLFGKQPAPN